MQCIFVIILWFIFSGFKMRNFLRHVNRRRVTQPARTKTIDQIKQPQSPRSLFNDFIEDFHTAQCYFSGTIQVAALSYGIFTTDMLITFLLIPLATNGVLPVAFTLFLLYAGDKQFRPHVVLLTSVCWLLSSVVYWTLYSHVIPIIRDLPSRQQEYRAYMQFYY
jgi:hypothetical protein